MKHLLSSFFLICSLSALAQQDTLPPPTDIEKLPSNDGTLTRVEEQPQFPGGDQALVDYMNTNLVYPDKMRQAHIEGPVEVAFTITAEGEVRDAHVQRGIADGELLHEEALRVVSAMPRWEPARVKGVAVPVVYVLTVRFNVAEQP